MATRSLHHGPHPAAPARRSTARPTGARRSAAPPRAGARRPAGCRCPCGRCGPRGWASAHARGRRRRKVGATGRDLEPEHRRDGLGFCSSSPSPSSSPLASGGACRASSATSSTPSSREPSAGSPTPSPSSCSSLGVRMLRGPAGRRRRPPGSSSAARRLTFAATGLIHVAAGIPQPPDGAGGHAAAGRDHRLPRLEPARGRGLGLRRGRRSSSCSALFGLLVLTAHPRPRDPRPPRSALLDLGRCRRPAADASRGRSGRAGRAAPARAATAPARPASRTARSPGTRPSSRPPSSTRPPGSGLRPGAAAPHRPGRAGSGGRRPAPSTGRGRRQRPAPRRGSRPPPTPRCRHGSSSSRSPGTSPTPCPTRPSSSRAPAQGAQRGQRRGRRRAHQRPRPVRDRRPGHRLHPRAHGHPLRGRARPRHQGRAGHRAVQEHRVCRRLAPTCASSARSRASRRSASRSPTPTGRTVSLGDVLRSQIAAQQRAPDGHGRRQGRRGRLRHRQPREDAPPARRRRHRLGQVVASSTR